MTAQSIIQGLACAAAAIWLGACGAREERASPSSLDGAPEVGPAEPSGAGQEPFYDYRRHLVEYVDDGTADRSPEHDAEVRIGWFGPSDPSHPLGGSLWEGALLAVEEANAEGGPGGKPLQLMPKWSENPWGTGIQGIAVLAFRERVCAVLGAPDSASAHLVEQIVAKAHLPFVNAVATEESLNYVNVPWIFSLAPPDREIAEAIARELESEARRASADRPYRLALVSSDDHDSRRLARALLSSLKRGEVFPGRHVQLKGGERDFAQVLDPLIAWNPTTIVILADPLGSARIANILRRKGCESRFAFAPQAGRRVFREELSAGDGATETDRLSGATKTRGSEPRDSYPVLWDPEAVGEEAQRFAARFRKRFGHEPDYASAYAYDSVRLICAAVAQAGTNRVRIREALRGLAPISGVTGKIEWDPTARRKGVRVVMKELPE